MWVRLSVRPTHKIEKWGWGQKNRQSRKQKVSNFKMLKLNVFSEVQQKVQYEKNQTIFSKTIWSKKQNICTKYKRILKKSDIFCKNLNKILKKPEQNVKSFDTQIWKKWTQNMTNSWKSETSHAGWTDMRNMLYASMLLYFDCALIYFWHFWKNLNTILKKPE